MFIPQNNPFCVKVRKSQYLQNSNFKHKNKQKSETNSTFSLMDETRTKVIFHEKQGRALMYILDIASLHLHKNEAWIRTYIFCNITFVKWVNTEVLHVTKPNWLHWMQLYAWRENITEATGVKSHWKFRQARPCHNRNGLKK